MRSASEKAGFSLKSLWACREEEWQAAQAEGREPDGTPWPIEDVEALERVPA